jgi:Fe-S oxidoreductase
MVPRGRIYLIKQIAEGQAVTEKTRLHLDRCLTCRNCETTCPSGVQYGQLIDIGRKWAEESTAPRKSSERLTRWLLKEGLTRPALFNSAMALGRLMRPLLPSELKRKVPINGVYTNQIKTDNASSRSSYQAGGTQYDADSRRLRTARHVTQYQSSDPACFSASRR